MVREFEDSDGRRWDVALGRASWGAFHALFVPREGSGARQTLLAAEASEDAARILHEADAGTLLELFRRSKPYEDGS